jgi:hypothetical protein
MGPHIVSRCTLACHRFVIGALALCAHGNTAAQAPATPAPWDRYVTPELAQLQLTPMQSPSLRLALGEHTALAFQPRPGQATDLRTTSSLPLAMTRDNLGLEFRTRRRTDGARGLLRVQLSADSVLNLRPRAGSLYVSYRTQF